MAETPKGLQFRIAELEHRLHVAEEEIKTQRKRTHDLAQFCQQIPDHDRRLRDIESVNPEVIATRLLFLEEGLRELREAQKANTKILWTIAVALITATLTTAIAISSGTFG